MPDTSIVVSAKDNYSAVMKKMLTVTESFDKDLKKVEKQMVNLSRNKAQLKIDVKDAKQKLKETTENYEKLNNAANRFAMEMAQANYDKAVRNLNAVSKAAKDAEKHISKIENKAGSNPGTFSSSLNSIASAIATSGFGNMVGNLLMNVGTSYTASTHGDDAGIRTSSILSSAATGAAMGMILPGVGNLVGFIGGALAGAVTGAFSAEMQIYEKKDDFFKDYYKGLYEEQQQAAESGLTGGSTTAGSREQSYKAFEKRLGEAEAASYLSDVKHMAARTNYGYDEILGYSKLLLNSYGTDKILGKDGAPGLLTTLSDATAGLNLAGADVEMFIKGLSRMRTTGKVTQEYLNYFSERGVDVYEALARGAKVDKSKVADMVTRGKIRGADAAEYIRAFLDQEFGGLSEELMGTYDAMVANLKDVETNVQEGYGTGYNTERKGQFNEDGTVTGDGTLADRTAALDGELGDKLNMLNKAAGFAKGYEENVKESYWLDVMEAVFSGDEGARTGLRDGVTFDEKTKAMVEDYRTQYLKAKYAYDKAEHEGDKAGMHKAALEMDKTRQAVEILAGETFGASETNKLVVESQNELIEETKRLAKAFGDWALLYEQNQLFTEGQASVPGGSNVTLEDSDGDGIDNKTAFYRRKYGLMNAWGLDRVPYDNYPALLHEGERVLTAQQAREADRHTGVSVVISGNEFHIREDADVDRVAQALLDKLQLAAVRG